LLRKTGEGMDGVDQYIRLIDKLTSAEVDAASYRPYKDEEGKSQYILSIKATDLPKALAIM